jgi:predicted ATPase
MQLVKTVRDPTLTRGEKVQELSRVLYFTVRVKLSWLRETRPVVAISGPDGAGKTTLALALQEFFARESSMTASYSWMRLGSYNVLGLLRAAGEPLVRHAELRSHSHAEVAWSRRTLLGRRQKLRHFWCYVLIADFVIKTWARRVQCRLHGGIHIFDRSAIDAAVDLATMYGVSSAHLPVALTPSPDLQILIKPAAGDGTSLYAQYEPCAAMVVNGGTPLASTVEQAARRVIDLISDSR